MKFFDKCTQIREVVLVLPGRKSVRTHNAIQLCAAA
jgi:hypothetical protein